MDDKLPGHSPRLFTRSTEILFTLSASSKQAEEKPRVSKTSGKEQEKK